MVIDYRKITEKELKDLSENLLRREVIIPVLKDLRSGYIDDTHGQNGCGIDILIKNKDIFGREIYLGVQCKKGDIIKKASGTNRSIETIINQIKEAYKTSFISSDCKDIYINGFYVIASGRVNDFARKFIYKMSDGQELILIIEDLKNEKKIETYIEYLHGGESEKLWEE